MRSSLVSGLAVCLLLAGGVGAIAEAPAGAVAESPAPEGILALLPADSTTHHVLETPEGPLRYVATAGTIELRNQSGAVSARMFYTAYTREDGGPERPITFAFNGGPGAASAYLHLGLAGPRIVELGPKGDDGATPALSDNPDSWLPFTDLVFIDPVGTGWSRAAGSDADRAFHGVRQDAESLAKMIALFTQRADRLSSPKYLLGESYGGFRAAKVATALRDSQGLLVSGIVMVSPMLEGRFLPGAAPDPLAAALQLPSLAAAELEREGRFSVAGVEAAERFAMTDYLVGLAGPEPRGAAGEAFYARVAEMTGIPSDLVARGRGFVGERYRRDSADGVVSPYDAAEVVADAYPARSPDYNEDPVLDGYTRAYGPAFVSYAARELGYATPITYTLLNTEVNRRWDWPDGRAGASASDDLADLFSVLPSFRLAIFHGYGDTLTPYRVSQYVVDQLPSALTEDRALLRTYRGGHMFYTDPASRHAVAEDARAFYAGGRLN
ncbi:MAG: carboxypeptidase [Rhodovulum sulfidophilum]|uniref:Carboxypeptidase n=1 Tax=Rhodovulum sulfidophilum TaxID=35806 RepID=A0A2W5NCE0_RHOSU|nr:MAG: carboxypeptidase [Rhodovulum sulfidophilum]